MRIIGLTGGIASGKSTAATHLGELGAKLIDADVLGHRVYEPGTPGFEQVVRAFGEDIVDAEGAIDRRILGAKVFGKPEEMNRLTGVVWPQIRRLAQGEIEAHRDRGEAVVVLEAAVLLEASWEDMVDEIWVVIVQEETAIERLAERNGMSREDALARIHSQLSNAERVARADVVIDNSGTLEELHGRLAAEWGRLAH